MIEYKQGVNARVPVRLQDGAGVAVTGVASGAVTATIEKSDGTFSTLTLSGANWIETTFGAFSGLGKYDLIIPGSATDTPGVLTYAVTTAGAAPYLGAVKIVANEEVDTYLLMIRALGLMHENCVMDQTLFDGGNNLTNARLRLYNSKTNANLAGGTGLLATYTVTATYAGDNIQTYVVVLEP